MTIEREATSRRGFLERLLGASLITTAAGAVTSQRADASAWRPASRRAPGIVQTVQGPIDASKLGVTLPHEHLIASSTGLLQTWPELFGGRAALSDRVVDGLKAARDEGVETIVDVTPADVGRDIRFIEEVSRRSGMQIVACTGHWLYPSVSMAARTVEELTDFFTREIEHGTDGTDIKPGVIKVATDRDGVTPFLEKALRAAARASKATGVPVTTHTYAPARIGEKQAEIFDAEGLQPAAVCLGHCDETDDIEYLTGLAKRGYIVGMDHLPQGLRPASSGLLSWERRADTVRTLIDAGFAERVFLSNDWYYALTIAPTGAMEAMDRMNPDGLLFTTRRVIPYLKQHGVPDLVIRTITIENPRRFFGGA